MKDSERKRETGRMKVLHGRVKKEGSYIKERGGRGEMVNGEKKRVLYANEGPRGRGPAWNGCTIQ